MMTPLVQNLLHYYKT